ncbi:restriction endonuclease subunit S [Patescibacteria group bacterium]|nr:restriction endonuclease subunit S [Patescibacteria group bacterium]
MKNNWQTKRLGEVCEVIAGQSPEGKFYNKTGNGLPFYQGKKEFTEKFIGEPTTWTTEITKEAKAGDILMSVRAPVGPINFATEKICIGRGLAAIRVSKEIDKDFLFNFLKKHENEIVGNAGAVFSSINKTQIGNIEIPLPPLPAQRRIVKILDEAFSAVTKAKENAEKNLQNSRELFESYLQSVFANPGDGWEEKKLGEVCEMINRGVSPKYTELKGVCVLNQKCIREHRVNFDLSRFHDLKNKKVSSDKFVQIGDVLVNSPGTGTLGRVAQVRELPVTATVDSHITIVRHRKNMFFSDFFGYALIFIEEEIAKRGEGCGGQTELARNTLKNDFKIIYPKSLHEQQRIVAKLNALSAETKKLEAIYQQKLADLDELKKSILKKAFEGEL